MTTHLHCITSATTTASNQSLFDCHQPPLHTQWQWQGGHTTSSCDVSMGWTQPGIPTDVPGCPDSDDACCCYCPHGEHSIPLPLLFWHKKAGPHCHQTHLHCVTVAPNNHHLPQPSFNCPQPLWHTPTTPAVTRWHCNAMSPATATRWAPASSTPCHSNNEAHQHYLWCAMKSDSSEACHWHHP